ncbi:TetR/AcrR family transcriptional regulator [Mycobacterium sp. 4858]|uniref:TetR/AcrR family transcriptional regulator n=1 Tax=Mycobacterium sp. 4858 TaxID=2057185 RepID=UPI00130486BA|nr:TetR/AcrR family transcriptional regulator [Mycobacterium sp. 4858]
MTATRTTVSPPKQARSRKAWARVLEAGVGILETTSLEEFTIAAVCERAGVSVAAIYSRVPNKDALFLAVYEYALAQMASERAVLEREAASYDELSTEDLVCLAVTTVADLFLSRTGLIRSIIWLSASHSEVRARGSQWMTELGNVVTTLLAPRIDEFPGADPHHMLDTCYRTIWASVAMHVAYGANFAAERRLTDEDFKADLRELALRYLLCRPST